MTTQDIQNLEAYLHPLLHTLDGLGHVARHLSPFGFDRLLASVEPKPESLRAVRDMPPWQEPYSALRPMLDQSAGSAIIAMEGLIEAAGPPENLPGVFKSLRSYPRALEALYPLAGILPPVSRFFTDPKRRDDMELQARLLKQPPPRDTGTMCFGDDPDHRQSFWIYIPETYDPATPHPLVFALHGGSGNGRGFLWSWVRAARSRGAIVVAPTSQDQTWAIQGEDRDSAHLAKILAFVRQRWSIDTNRILLTGMSDGGTFTYTYGLTSDCPFTHLAPVAAAFHPMLVPATNPSRMKGLPIHIMHGVHDWMFRLEMADDAARLFTTAGANVTYRRVTDLGHTYGMDLSTVILDWLLA